MMSDNFDVFGKKQLEHKARSKLGNYSEKRDGGESAKKKINKWIRKKKSQHGQAWTGTCWCKT